MSDVNHINILFAIAVNLMYEAEKSQVPISATTKDAFYKWFAEQTRTEVNTPVDAQIGIGFDLFKIITGELKSEALIRE